MNEYLNSKEAADYLGVSDRFVRDLCTNRRIEHERLNGRNLRFKKEWLDDYLASIRVTPEITLKETENNE